MSEDWRAWLGKFALAIAWGGVTVSCWESIVLAQIIPDDTLGAESSVVSPDNIKGIESDRISGGAVRGSNLFHSFQEFNIGEGRGGYFDNPAAIENIFSRVTGSNPSNILGTLGVLGNANLFFLNPNGILFGPNASLDLKGSFIGTTADSIFFPDGKQFSGTNPESPPLLTVNVKQPIGLKFEGRKGIISNQGNLDVDAGQNLALVGGDITLDGGSLMAPGGKVELGGLAEAGNVIVNSNGSLSFPDGVARADVTLTNNAFVNVRAAGGGSISVNARNFELREGSQLLAGIGAGIETSGAQGGDIEINATDIVSIEGISNRRGASISNNVKENSVGNAGSISITAGSLLVTNGAQLSASTFGVGDAGSVNITATEKVLLDGSGEKLLGPGGAFSRINTGARGEGGNISITTRSLEIINGAILSASTTGEGNAGTVKIQAESVVFDGEDSDGLGSGAFSQVGSRGRGNAGGISINTSSLEVTNGAELAVSTKGEGNAGAVNIIATEKILFDGETSIGLNSGAFSLVDPRARGNAGGISITTGSLEVTNGAQLNANTFGKGDAGSVTITATDLVKFDGKGDIFSGASSQVGAGAVGKAGGVSITTGSLEVTNGAQLDTSTFGKGDAGSITITATDLVKFDGKGDIFISGAFSAVASGAFSAVAERASGNAGGIKINTPSLILRNKAVLSTFTFGDGNAGTIAVTANTLEASSGGQLQTTTSGNFDAGNITLKVEDNINLAGEGSGIFANTVEGSSGNGGSIIIDPNTVIIRDGAQIAVNSDGSGVGGNIDLHAGSLTLDKGIMTAATASNQGGDINLTLSDLLTLRNNSQITATAGTDEAGGNGGNITIDAPFIIAFPNEDSDITANAFAGKGGKINIDTNGIFGISKRDDQTSLSDITASSELGPQGAVEINPSAVDPTRGLNNLPQEAVEAEVAQSCQETSSQSTLEFFDIGRGGLPPTPEDLFSSEIVIAEWIPLDLADDKVQAPTSEKSFTEDEIKNMTLLTTFLCQSE